VGISNDHFSGPGRSGSGSVDCKWEMGWKSHVRGGGVFGGAVRGARASTVCWRDYEGGTPARPQRDSQEASPAASAQRGRWANERGQMYDVTVPGQARTPVRELGHQGCLPG